MGIFDLISDVVEITGNVVDIVVAPVEVVVSVAKDFTEEMAEVAEDIVDSIKK